LDRRTQGIHDPFFAGGFRSLFRMPARAIRDVATNAEHILGPEMLSLEARLAEAEDDRMPRIAEDFLLARLARQRSNANAAAVLSMTACIEAAGDGSALPGIASKHNLGLRQMERLFQEFVGVSPKVLDRLHRAKRALMLHRKQPNQDWATIAAASGYFDQAHFIRDFRCQNAMTPAEFALHGRPAHEFRSRFPSPSVRMSRLYNRPNRTSRYS